MIRRILCELSHVGTDEFLKMSPCKSTSTGKILRARLAFRPSANKLTKKRTQKGLSRTDPRRKNNRENELVSNPEIVQAESDVEAENSPDSASCGPRYNRSANCKSD